MSRWTENKKKYSNHGCDVWIATPKLYKVTADGEIFYHRTQGNLDYKKTVINFKKAGYTDINILYMGRDVSI